MTTLEAVAPPGADELAAMYLQFELEKLYTVEAALLDAHQYEDWLELWADDARYFMPIRRTRTRRELSKEFTQPGEMAYFDDDKALLESRVRKIRTGTAWAEDPPSRTRHLITNVRVAGEVGAGDDGVEGDLDVWSNFILYRTRLKSEEMTWVGSRNDKVRRSGGGLLIADRKIYLEQTVILSQNLSNFF